MATTLDVRRQRLIRALQNCATAAEHCVSAAIGMGEDVEASIASCRDAASLCRLNAALFARGSRLAGRLLPISVEASNIAADECARHIGAFFEGCVEACGALRAIAELDGPGR